MPDREDMLPENYDEMSYEERLELIRSIRKSRVAPPKTGKPKKTGKQKTAQTQMQKLLASMTPEQIAELKKNYGVE